MDSYLEGHLWSDVHQRLANVIAEVLAPKIAPKYVARVDTYMVEDTNPADDIGILYPDIALLRRHENIRLEPIPVADAAVVTEPDVELMMKVSVRIPVVEIRDTARNKLITAIEILSPVNKREPGRLPYLQKQEDLHRAGVHLLEIDLLRRGHRNAGILNVSDCHYLFSLWRAGTLKAAFWKRQVFEPLPILPVPLKNPDSDVALSLKEALDTIYARGMYHLSIDYSKDPPPPAFSPELKKWTEALVLGQN